METNNLLRSLIFYAVLLFTPITILAQTQVGSDIDGENTGDRSGWSIELSPNGNRIVIGAVENNDNGTNAGHTRIYELEDEEWVQLGNDIDGEAEGDRSGISVALSSDGTRVAIGAENNNGTNGINSGHVRIYEWNGTEWIQLGNDIDGEEEGDRSGISVALSSNGDRIVIGAIFNDGDGTDGGHVRVYEWNGNSWGQIGGDINGETGGGSGRSVDISGNGDRIVIGDDSNDANGANAGHIRIYEWDGTNWIQLGEDIDGISANDRLGWFSAISSDGNRIIASAVLSNNYVQIYEWDGTNWIQIGSTIEGTGTDGLFGWSVDISSTGDRIIIGVATGDGDGEGEPFSGYARVYEFINDEWVQEGTDLDGTNTQDWFGYSVSISDDGERAASSSIFHDGDTGHVKVFDMGSPLPVELSEFKGYTKVNGNQLEWSTISEYNNAYFIIEQSSNGYDFFPIIQIQGQGNSNQYQKYEYLHRTMSNGIIYYRLKQVDINGSFEYSPIISVTKTKDNFISIAPNPTNGSTVINGIDTEYTIQVYDQLGSLLLEQKNESTLDLSHLSKGVYFLHIKTAQGSFVRKVEKI